MKVLSDYTINYKTVLFSGEKDADHHDCTKVMEGEATFLVKMSPLALINKTLLRNGSNLRGALKSSKFILGQIRHLPIKVSASQGIFLFPVQAENLIWFSLNHVVNAKSLGPYETKVILSYGQSIHMNLEESAFKRKCSNAEELRKGIIKNSKCPLVFYLENIKDKNG